MALGRKRGRADPREERGGAGGGIRTGAWEQLRTVGTPITRSREELASCLPSVAF